jgi:hypothetical protein
MKRRFIIGPIDKRQLRIGAKSVAVFRPSTARGRTWSVTLQQGDQRGRSILRVIGTTAARATH